MMNNMKTLMPFFLAVLVSSCSATVAPKKAPVQAPLHLKDDLNAAKASADAGETGKAVARLQQIAKQYPESDLADDALFMAGQLQFSNQRYPEALASFTAIVNGNIRSPLEAQANIKVVQILTRLARFDEAKEVLNEGHRWEELSSEQRFEYEKLRYEAFAGLKDYQEALLALVTLAESNPNPAERDKYRSIAYELLESKLSVDDLRVVANDRAYSFLNVPAKYRYALLKAEQREFSNARSLLAEITKEAPGSQYAEKAMVLIEQIDSRHRVDARTIGVVLPLSGKQAAIGYKALRGVQLGLGIYGGNGSNLRLAVIDSEGNPNTAKRAIERLVTEDNVIGIIGGLLSRTASVEALQAHEFDVPTILLSQKAGLTQTGDSIFRNAVTSQMQVRHLVDVAMGQFGYRNFAVMFPNDAYGVEFSNLFWDEVKARGGQITAAQTYDPKETDFRGHVQRLVGLFYQEDRADEYQRRLRALAEKQVRRSSRQDSQSVEDVLPPIIDFDALFIPDSARAVGQIAPMLAYNNVNNVKLIGTNLWNSPSFVSRGERFVDGALFVDAYLASDPGFQNSEFVSRFKRTFKDEPGLIEIQAYDSALVLRQLLAEGERTRVGLKDRLKELQNFPGAIGSLSVSRNREFLRPLSTLTVRGGRIGSLETIKN